MMKRILSVVLLLCVLGLMILLEIQANRVAYFQLV